MCKKITGQKVREAHWGLCFEKCISRPAYLLRNKDFWYQNHSAPYQQFKTVTVWRSTFTKKTFDVQKTNHHIHYTETKLKRVT